MEDNLKKIKKEDDPKQNNIKQHKNIYILSFASLKLCGLAGRFEYNKPQFEDNFLGPKGPRRFFAREISVAKGAWIFPKNFLVSIHINLKFPER
jgi:hypothetical protein